MLGDAHIRSALTVVTHVFVSSYCVLGLVRQL
jgi:hypothetical protein